MEWELLVMLSKRTGMLSHLLHFAGVWLFPPSTKNIHGHIFETAGGPGAMSTGVEEKGGGKKG